MGIACTGFPIAEAFPHLVMTDQIPVSPAVDSMFVEDTIIAWAMMGRMDIVEVIVARMAEAGDVEGLVGEAREIAIRVMG